MAEADKHPSHFEIHVDGVRIEVTEQNLTGAQIKAKAGKDPQYQLFLEEKGNAPDQLIADNQTVKIQNGLHFYTVPPATFGA
ncbi:MAG TPA: multiubiquitin domain-containing protein [Tepidisphaeraceae bacterium]|jgi:hypothetical protein